MCSLSLVATWNFLPNVNLPVSWHQRSFFHFIMILNLLSVRVLLPAPQSPRTLEQAPFVVACVYSMQPTLSPHKHASSRCCTVESFHSVTLQTPPVLQLHLLCDNQTPTPVFLQHLFVRAASCRSREELQNLTERMLVCRRANSRGQKGACSLKVGQPMVENSVQRPRFTLLSPLSLNVCVSLP